MFLNKLLTKLLIDWTSSGTDGRRVGESVVVVWTVGTVTVVGGDGVVDAVSSPQYILLTRAMSFSLILKRCPIVSPFKSLNGMIVSLPSIEKAVLP